MGSEMCIRDRIGTGFKDEDLEEHTVFFKQHVSEGGMKTYYRHGDGEQPNQWFEPVQVWEVKAADLSISPVYTAAIGEVDAEKGISLRFPRFIRVREDKRPEDATTSAQVAELFLKQQNNASAAAVHEDDDDMY